MAPNRSSRRSVFREGMQARKRSRQLAKKVLGWKIPARPPTYPLSGQWHVEGTPLHEIPAAQRAFIVSPRTSTPRFLEEPAAAVALSLRWGDLPTVTDTEFVASGEEWALRFTWTEEGEPRETGEERKLGFSWQEAAEVLSDQVFPELVDGADEKAAQRAGFSIAEFGALVDALVRVRTWLEAREGRWFRLGEEPHGIWRAHLAGPEEGRTDTKHVAPTPGAAIAHTLCAEIGRGVGRLEAQVRELEAQVEAGVVFEEVVPALDLPDSTDPDALRTWRKRQELTQQSAADLINVSRSAWQKWELDDHPRPGWLLLAIEGAMVRERRKEEMLSATPRRASGPH